ncbi:hydrolase [Novipirellula rosea]|uniref:Hydrolase n=1 Tax=Novipirellula rosea TaxID=1031540 RepID=A0ABP8M7U7_9BACT
MMSEPIQAAIQWMHTQQSASVDRLERWCNQNSWSMDVPQLQQMADTLCADFRSFGVSFDQVPLGPMRLLDDAGQWYAPSTGPALLWHHQPDAQQRVLLMIHYDTVYPAVGSTTADRCVRQGDRLLGPGTADAKGGIAVIAMAVEAGLRFGLFGDLGVSILLNPDEEIGSTASEPLMRALAPEFDAALVFEPTLPDGKLVAARKGSGGFAFVVRGRSAHAGRNPEQGRNAIVHLSRIVVKLAELHDPDGGVLVNVGKIAGGGPLNRVPDYASVHLNVRVTDTQAMQKIESMLETIRDQFSGDGYEVELNGMLHSPPKCSNDALVAMQAKVATAANAIGRSIEWQDTGGACDGCKLAAMNLPNIDTMGITGDKLHSSEEYCVPATLVPAAATVLTFLANSIAK